MNGYLCSPKLYKYKGYFFEWHSYCGPAQLRKDGEIRKYTQPGFWDMISEWQKMPEDEKEKYFVGGGCVAFGYE